MKRPYLVALGVTAAVAGLGLVLRPAGTVEGGVRKAERAPALNQLLGPPTLRGKVVLAGRKPDLKKLNKELLTLIKRMRGDADYCLKCPEDQKVAQDWRIGDNDGVGNVFVWIEPLTRTQFFKIDERQLREVPKEVTMDQPFCAFVPHCVILFPKYRDPKNARRLLETGQKFVVKNDARITHNVKMDGGPLNPVMNVTLPAKEQLRPQVFEPSKEVIVIRCSIHSWMGAYARAFDHPYAALSVVGKDAKDPRYGTYEIKNVPAGRVRVIAWHERAGYLNGAKGEEIELRAGTNTKDFKLTAR